MSKYSEKLKDPRWQKKRLEALERSNFSCDNCGDTKEELHVHHKIYKKGLSPWEYDVDDMSVLCKDCHNKIHIQKERLNKVIGNIVCSEHIERIVGYALALTDDVWPQDIDTPDGKVGYADLYRTSVSAVIHLIRVAEEDKTPLGSGVLLARQVEG